MSLLRRALTGAFATALAATALTALAPPAAAFSDFCPYDESTRLLTARGRDVRLWVYEDPYSWNGRTVVCFMAGEDVVGGSLTVYGSPLSDGPPSVTPDLDYEGCPDLVDVEDPVTVVVEAGLICVGFGRDAAVALSVSLPYVNVQEAYLILDEESEVGRAVCAAGPLVCPNGYPYLRIV